MRNDAMHFWESRDAYHVQTFVYGVMGLVMVGEPMLRFVAGDWIGALAGVVRNTFLLSLLVGLRWCLRWTGRRVRAWLARFGTLLLVALLNSGCAMWFQHTHPPIERTLVVPEAPDVAFTRALLVTHALGCTMWTQDRQGRTLQAFYKAETQLTVSVQPKAKGSELHVVHHNLPTYFGQGSDGNLSAMFLARYAQSLAGKAGQ